MQLGHLRKVRVSRKKSVEGNWQIRQSLSSMMGVEMFGYLLFSTWRRTTSRFALA
jgi:hypothetical protein